ncbi:MAG: polyprenyl synthetase family protein [Leptospiraceae bacterium]|nr:polyprenyl synthetase family protein [Leptospiraceae bacterium]
MHFFKVVKRFVVFSGGKRIRPFSHYYFSKLLNYEGKEWIDVAAIGELIHAASLLHDDVIDNSDQRRGKPTLNATHGNKKAILGGDYLLACGIDHLITLPHKLQLLPVFTRVIRNLAVAEILQMEYEKNPQMDFSIYEKIIEGKTADLFSAMVEASAILMDYPPEQTKKYREIGLKMGRLFQIRDDYLDYFSNENQLGKRLYLDYERGIITYPILVLRSYMNKSERNFFDFWGSDEFRKQNLAHMLELMKKYQISQRIKNEIDQKLDEIINFIKEHQTKNPNEKEELISTLRQLSVSIE